MSKKITRIVGCDPNGSIQSKSWFDKDKKDLPNPTKEDLESPEFNAIWDVIKSWDINVPEYYSGYMGGNGSHVKLILQSLVVAMRDKKIKQILE